MRKPDYITKDITVWVETNNASFDVTFFVKAKVMHDGDGSGRKWRVVEIEERTPIHAAYSDMQDHEHEWRYGEDMPKRIAKCLEDFEWTFKEEIERKLIEAY